MIDEPDIFEIQKELSSILNDELIAQLETELSPSTPFREELVHDLSVWVHSRRLAGGNALGQIQENRRLGLKLLPTARKRCIQASQTIKILLQSPIGGFRHTFVDKEEAELTLAGLESVLKSVDRAEKVLRDISPIRGPHDLLQEKLLVALLSGFWLEATNAPPPIDREGRFYRFLSMISDALPADCRPNKLKAETVKDWLIEFRRKNGHGGS